MELLEYTVSAKVVLVLAVQYAISFYFFGYLHGKNKKEDEFYGRKRFWVLKYWWKRLRE